MTELVKLTRESGMSDASFCRMIKLLASRREGVISEDALLGAYAESVAESFLAGSRDPAPDCRTCGACCAYYQEIPVAISDATPRSLTWQVWDDEDRDGAKTMWLRREPQRARCVALDGRVGEKVSCAVYPLRPKSCRAFEAGSDRCHAVRRLYGIDPPLSEEERRRQALLLEARANASDDDDDQEVEVYELELGGAREQAPLLVKLIQYNLEKLEEIIAEIKRLLGLLDDAPSRAGKTKCLRALDAVSNDADSIRRAMAGVELPEEIDSLRKRELERLALELLRIGMQSQEAVGRASKRIAHLGKVAFEMLGLRLPQGED